MPVFEEFRFVNFFLFSFDLGCPATIRGKTYLKNFSPGSLNFF